MSLQREIRARLRMHGLRPDRRLGQNFLVDEEVLEEIAATVGASATAVLEIGAGPGTLTARLLKHVSSVVALEKDRRLIPVLREQFGDQLDVVEGDALQADLSGWGRGRAVAGNIPYLISSPLLFRLLDQRANLGPVTLMVQREVANRWLAVPGTKAFGIPSVLLQVYALPRRVIEVSRTSFWPAPRVDSTVVHWSWRPTPAVAMPDPKHFSRVVRASFSQRRKKLRNALATVFPVEQIRRAALREDLDRRAETLSIEEFGRLAEGLATGRPADTSPKPTPEN